MEQFLGTVAIGGFLLGALATVVAFRGGSDIQLILGALYGLCGITAAAGSAILSRMEKKPTHKEDIP